ncbi:hypothetical protein RMATCC62417_16399 [Rhizopus microsporus]|nr:hypothetical protein RMATCC62417_16399 [Rhizopus microsporus]
MASSRYFFFFCWQSLILFFFYVNRSKENTPSEDPPNEYTDQMAIISPSIVIPDLPQHEHPVHDIRRSYDDAVLYACQQLGDTEDNQRKTLFITDTLKLKPFAIINADGIEQNGLAHANVIEKAVRSASTIQSTIPSKRSLHAMETTQADLCFSCYPPPPGDLGSLFAISPYGKLLRQRKYTMLSNELCDLANHDWRFHPQTKYYVAQLFAGAILFRTDNHQAIIINTVEAYGRGKSVDIHREIFGMKKGTAIETSLPPAFNIRYPDVWPTTLSTSDGKKLLIGTQSCNLLVTSSLRLDKVDDPCVGATTVNFDLQNKTNSLACAIYLDVESVTKSLALANEPATKSINKYGYLYQMRQLNSKYDDGTSYFLVRCSSHFARNHAAQPFTLFTLADFNNVRNPAASLFNAIACNVLESGNTAVVNKGLILELQARSTDTCIPILKNAQLNKSLEKLAILLHPSLANANKSVQKAIHQQFTSHP